MSKQLVEVRDQFSKFMRDPAHWNMRTREIAVAFLDSQRVSIPEPWRQITINGLVQMSGPARKRKPAASAGGVWDLFAGCGVEPVVVIDEKVRGLPSLTLSEAQACLNRQMKEHEVDEKKIRAWRALIKRAKPFMTRGDMTLEEGLGLAAAAEAAKKKKDDGR